METSATRVRVAKSEDDWQVRVEAIAQDELRRSAFYEVRQVEPCVRDRVLRLTGRVSSYYFKQMAQAAVMHRLEGVVLIENEIVVSPG